MAGQVSCDKDDSRIDVERYQRFGIHLKTQIVRTEIALTAQIMVAVEES